MFKKNNSDEISKEIMNNINECKTMDGCGDIRRVIDEYELTDHSKVIFPSVKDMRNALCDKTYEVYEATKKERTMKSFK